MGVVPVHKALEDSSDVAAVKLALKVGPDKFLPIHSRLRIRQPHRRRASRRNPRPAASPQQVGSYSIGSIAIGQEVGVTPLQLVSMVSTIANGGVYLPPHVLMSQITRDQWPAAALADAGSAIPGW